MKRLSLLFIFAIALVCFGNSIPITQQAAFFSAKPAIPAGGGSGGFPSGADADWRFNNSLSDSSGGGATLTISSGSASYTTDEASAANKAIQLSGAQSASASGTSLGNYTSGNFSISCWAKSTDTTFQGHPVIIGKGLFGASGYYIIFIESPSVPGAGGIQVTISDGVGTHTTQTSDSQVSVGTWYHIVFTRSGSTGKIYINGSDATSVSDVVDPGTDAHSFTVGDYSGGGHLFIGNIAQVSIWPRALSPTEVADLHTAGSL
jgi:hypothetical protein